jgi:hypothetical protein
VTDLGAAAWLGVAVLVVAAAPVAVTLGVLGAARRLLRSTDDSFTRPNEPAVNPVRWALREKVGVVIGTVGLAVCLITVAGLIF